MKKKSMMFRLMMVVLMSWLLLPFAANSKYTYSKGSCVCSKGHKNRQACYDCRSTKQCRWNVEKNTCS